MTTSWFYYCLEYIVIWLILTLLLSNSVGFFLNNYTSWLRSFFVYKGWCCIWSLVVFIHSSLVAPSNFLFANKFWTLYLVMAICLLLYFRNSISSHNNKISLWSDKDGKSWRIFKTWKKSHFGPAKTKSMIDISGLDRRVRKSVWLLIISQIFQLALLTAQYYLAAGNKSST